jgi:hypothetical protein
MDRDTSGDFEVVGGKRSRENGGGKRSNGGSGVNTGEDLLFGVERVFSAFLSLSTHTTTALLQAFSELSVRCAWKFDMEKIMETSFPQTTTCKSIVSNKNQNETIR